MGESSPVVGEGERYKKVHYVTGLLTLFYGVYMVLALVLPLYRVYGVLDGLVAFSYYRVTYYGAPVTVDELDRTSYMAAPLVLFTVYMVFSGANLLLALLEGEDYTVQLRLCFTGGLVGAVSSAVFLGLYSYFFTRAVSTLSFSLDHVTSAGRLILGSSNVQQFPYTGLLLNPLVHLVLALATLLSSTLSILLHTGRGWPTKPHEAEGPGHAR